MAGVTGVRPEFIQVTGYELASEAILLAVDPFLVVRMQSSTRADALLLAVSLCLRFLNYLREARKSTSGNECLWMSQKRIAKHDCAISIGEGSSGDCLCQTLTSGNLAKPNRTSPTDTPFLLLPTLRLAASRCFRSERTRIVLGFPLDSRRHPSTARIATKWSTNRSTITAE